MSVRIREKHLAKDRALKRRKRHLRVRRKVKGSPERPRLVVFRSHKHIYAQLVIDSPVGPAIVITGASTLSPEIREELRGKTKTEAAKLVGQLIAKRAIEKGYRKVAFDRAGYRYIGRVKALAEGAREGGLEF